MKHKLLLGIFSVLISGNVLLSRDGVENVVVYHDEKEFAGWPANEGMWIWDDEVLVGFEAAKYTPVEGNHSVDRDSPKRIVFARSMDGGKTWKAEEHPEIAPPEYIGDPTKYVQKSTTAKDPVASPGGFDFTHPDFAMKIRGGTFYVTTNRGRLWEGPYIMPLDQGYPESRPNYIVTGKDSMLIFGNARVVAHGIKYARTCLLETRDAGKTFQFITWIGEDLGAQYKGAKKSSEPGDVGSVNVFSIMPSVVKQDNRYVVALRQRIERAKWTDIYESTNEGRTWKKISTLEKGASNPAALVDLGEGKIAAVYGNRRGGKTALGVSAKLSADGGRTWSDEIHLRGDAKTWDLGYARAILNKNKQIVACYYYNTRKIPENHIAATIWDWTIDWEKQMK